MGTVYQYLAPQEAIFRPTNAAAYVDIDGSVMSLAGIAFDTAGSESCRWQWTPFGYAGGDLTVEIIWYPATGTSGTVAWGAGVAAITPGVDTTDVEAKAFGGTPLVLSGSVSGTRRLQTTTVTVSGSDLNSMAEGDECWLQVVRQGSGDSMSGDAILTSVRLSYSDT